MTTPPNDDSELRGLLNDAVSDVHPEGGTEMIRARAKGPSKARWLPLTLAAAVATVLVISGAAWLARQGDDDPPAAAPGRTTPTKGAASAAPARTATVPVYYVGETASGPRLFKETHQVTGTTKSDLQVAVDELISGQPLDPDYESPWPYGPMTSTATSDGSEITVDLGLPSDSGGMVREGDEQRALQALVWTADAVTDTDLPVRVTIGGEPLGDSYFKDIPMPVQRASADSVLSTVSITTPAQGATVPTRFEVTGQAATFEANVVWELKQGDTVARHGFATAEQCCTLSPYTFTVTAAPGSYTLVVHDTDESDGEGIGTSEDTKAVTVE